MSVIGIIVAMDKELNLVLGLMGNPAKKVLDGFEYYSGTLDRQQVYVAKCGIGKVNAAITALKMIEVCHVDMIINTGVAGGTGNGAGVLDVVVADRVAYHDVWCGPETIDGQAAGCPQFFVSPIPTENLKTIDNCKVGLIASGDIFVSRLEDLDRIRRMYPDVMAVDMESAAIAQVCYNKGVDFLAVRVVSDTPGAADNIAQYENFWEEAPRRSFDILKRILGSIFRSTAQIRTDAVKNGTMEKIPSFTIDHNRLLRGIYVSRKDTTESGDILTTFDIRMTEPNRQDAVMPEALHTIEHLAATWLRNNPTWKDRVVYWGPMGCCTGNYLILKGNLKPDDISPLMSEMFAWIASYEGDIPGATPRDCGNYKFNDAEEARRVARRFHDEVLCKLTAENTNYPS